VFEMAASTQSTTKCEVRYVTRFLNAKGEHPAKIHEQIVAVYGDVMNQQNVTKWCREFSEGRTDDHNEQGGGRPSLISDLLQKSEGEICANQHQTIIESHHVIPETSKTTTHKAVTENFSFLWISAAISNTCHSNKVSSTTAKQAQLTVKGSRSTAVLSHYA
jgi:hypothetical protein